MNKLAATTILLVICSGLASCSFHRLAAGKKAKSYDSTAMHSTAMHAILPQPDTIIAAVAPDTSDIAKELVQQLTPVWEARINYKTFSGKAKVHFTGPDNDKEFTAHFRVRKDSVIWVNVTFDAIPVARLLITQDSFFLLNTINKEITRIPLNQAAKILPTKVDFTSLQNLVTGEPLRGGKITDATGFGGSWTIQAEDSSYIQRITYNKADTTMRTGQLRTRDPKGPQAMTAYGNYETIGNRRISTSRTLHIQNGNDVYSLDMNFTKVDFDEPLDFPFTIPRSYTEKQPKP